MSKSEPVPPLQVFMASDQLRRATQKRLIGGESVRAGDFWTILGALYVFWALIGRAFKDDTPSLMQLLDVKPGNESKFVSLFKEKIDERLQRYHQLHGQQPDSFCALIVETEYAKVGLTVQSDNVKPLRHAAQGEVDMRNVNLWRRVEMVGAEGICFGLLYPELTREIVSRQYESIDDHSEDWTTFRSLMEQAGRTIPKGVTTYSPSQAERDALAFLEMYIRQMRPELASMMIRLDKGQSPPRA